MTDSPLDQKVKHGVLSDSFKMLDLSWKRKNKYINSMKREMHNRLTGVKRQTAEENEISRIKFLEQKDKYELNNCGGYERIYPMMPIETDRFKKM